MVATVEERTRDARLRRLAKGQGCRLAKSRTLLSIDNYGGYQIVDDNNYVVAGERFDLSLDDVEAWLQPESTDE